MSLWEWAAWSKGWDAARTGDEEPGGPLSADQRAEAEAMLDNLS